MKIVNIVNKTKETVGTFVGRFAGVVEFQKNMLDKYTEIVDHCGKITLAGCNAISKASDEIEKEIALIKNNSKQIMELTVSEAKIKEFTANYV